MYVMGHCVVCLLHHKEGEHLTLVNKESTYCLVAIFVHCTKVGLRQVKAPVNLVAIVNLLDIGSDRQ